MEVGKSRARFRELYLPAGKTSHWNNHLETTLVGFADQEKLNRTTEVDVVEL